MSFNKTDEHQVTTIFPKPILNKIDSLCSQLELRRSQFIRIATKQYIREQLEQSEPELTS